MPTLLASGTTTVTTLDVEETLATDTSNDTYVLHADLSALANDETLILRLKTKVLTGGTSRILYECAWTHAQGAPNKQSPPVDADIECQATIEQSGGTKRAIPWALLGR